jgi:predicted naringenin-chalcone synthase
VKPRRRITLFNFETCLPPIAKPQAELVRWSLELHLLVARMSPDFTSQDAERLEKFFQRYSVNPSILGKRSFECPDILLSPAKAAETGRIYRISKSQPAGVDIAERARFFSERAKLIFQHFYAEAQASISHLIHVTCTGYVSPSAAQLLVAGKGWGNSVGVTHAYHMGCYASLPAIRIAEGLVLARDEDLHYKVDLVHTEMCGLHMNPMQNTPEQLVVQSLFADGHIKYSAQLSRVDLHGYEVHAIHEVLAKDSDGDMSWGPEPWGMQMNLSREVPTKIKSAIGGLLATVAHQAEVEVDVLLKSAIFAIHPGGPKIIDAVQEALGLVDLQTCLSRKVLSERGNMSSSTLPHVWDEILSSGEAPPGRWVVSFAFGPGLTLFGAVFRVI